MATSNTQAIPSFHADFVHDIQFDFYGRRIATCSGDRTVKVWNLDENGIFSSSAILTQSNSNTANTNTNTNTNSNTNTSIQAHRSAVWRVSWAHPEYGQLLATCGADNSAAIWEEVQITSTNNNTTNINKNWVEKARLSDARRSVNCVEFAPRHLGLMLATGSADGCVRIYEAIDVVNLHHWPLQGTIELEETVVHEELGVTSLSWCQGRFEPKALVIGGSSGSVLVYRYSDAARQWQLAIKLRSHARGVLDVAWAPNVGRSYHLISSVGMDGKAMVHRLKRTKNNSNPSNEDSANLTNESSKTLQCESSVELDTKSSEVWRCKWNVTGTVLATSGDGGMVKLWKSDYYRNLNLNNNDRNNGENAGLSWRCVSEVVGDIHEA
eukprot:CAMPEP_0116043118 /NCGR_PEP_ID=MMETSP0321-20121206/26144_1 /TAXON_ID=163516 /ORGANISM="Leptocylindrus danicus var. danicus, Strain B650" /LENGTH=381 /DNA_ID=CAMNT_0003523823 /DNA_START=43 /DNA_END=1188 /DNA_ORIENTATION=+